MDRIDMHIEVPRLPTELLHRPTDEFVEGSASVRERVEAARNHQLQRTGHKNSAIGRPNSALSSREVENICVLDDAASTLLHRAMEQLRLSARAYHRILKVARTIADLDGQSGIQTAHVSEAIGYRRLDRQE